MGRNGIPVQANLTFANVAQFIARTPCRLLSVAIDDVLGVADQINVPGTVNEYQNWMRRMPIDLEELWEDEDIRRLAVDLAAEGRATN